MTVGRIIILVVILILGTAVTILYDKPKGIIGTIVAILLVSAASIASDMLSSAIMDDVTDSSAQIVDSSGKETGSDQNSDSLSGKLSGLSVGDMFTFGSYEQDGNTSNGAEPIEWIVLSTERDRALVISKSCLDCVQYNGSFSDVVWRTCSLREWLNDDFYNTAFSENEKEFIQLTNLVNSGNPKYITEGGGNTNDRIFCLSIEEAEGYLKYPGERFAQPTRYAEDKGACGWWLRTPGQYYNLVAAVLDSGSISAGGRDVNRTDVGVRPAFYIELDK